MCHDLRGLETGQGDACNFISSKKIITLASPHDCEFSFSYGWVDLDFAFQRVNLANFAGICFTSIWK